MRDGIHELFIEHGLHFGAHAHETLVGHRDGLKVEILLPEGESITDGVIDGGGVATDTVRLHLLCGQPVSGVLDVRLVGVICDRVDVRGGGDDVIGYVMESGGRAAAGLRGAHWHGAGLRLRGAHWHGAQQVRLALRHGAVVQRGPAALFGAGLGCVLRADVSGVWLELGGRVAEGSFVGGRGRWLLRL